jgi:hypothetical protein
VQVSEPERDFGKLVDWPKPNDAAPRAVRRNVRVAIGGELFDDERIVHLGEHDSRIASARAHRLIRKRPRRWGVGAFRSGV